MAEKKEHKIVQAETGTAGKVVHEAKPVGNASGLRAGAIILWVVAFIFEILAYLVSISLGAYLLYLLGTLWLRRKKRARRAQSALRARRRRAR